MIVLTDIEGTTSSVSFVKDVMFPYSHDQLDNFVRSKSSKTEILALLLQFKSEWFEATQKTLGESITDTIAALKWSIKEDLKLTALKSLQGIMWKDAFESGAFKSHLYQDSLLQFNIWSSADIPVYVYSSGSVQAQRLYFQYCEQGDMRKFFRGHFDTEIGAKIDVQSYAKIAKQIGANASEIVFVSDVVQELEAAATAGMRVIWMARPDNELLKKQDLSTWSFPTISSFCEFDSAVNQTGVFV
jgi:enolase-phosphatase E1